MTQAANRDPRSAIRDPQSPRRDVLAVSGLALLAGWLYIGDFGVRLANAWFDDSPPVFATWWVDPARFAAGDPLPTYAATYLYGTAVNWIPAALLRFFNIDPEPTSLLIALAQPTLTALALFVFAFRVTNSRVVAWASALFGLAAQAWTWNLALYTTQLDTPYAGQIALPFAVFAALMCIEARPLALAAWLTALSLVHPAIGITSTAVFGSFLLRQATDPRSAARTLTPLLLPCLVAVAIVMIPGSPAGGAVANSELIVALRTNRHFNPFESHYLWTFVLPAVVGVSALVILAARRLGARWQPGYGELLQHGALLVVGFLLLQLAALQFGWTRVIQLGAHRFSGVLVLLALPALLQLLLTLCEQARPAIRFAAAAILLLLATHGAGLPWLLILACFLAGDHLVAVKRRAVDTVVIAWAAVVIAWGAAAVLLESRLGSRALFAVLLPGVYPDPIWLPVALAGAALIAAVPRNRGTAVVALLAFVLLGRSIESGQSARQTLPRAVADAQLWARANTPTTAVFVIEPPVNWRNRSRRAAIPLEAAPFHLYSRSQRGKALVDSMQAFRARASTPGVEDWAAFRARFGGDYLVRLVSAPPVGPTIYRNTALAIYRLP